MNTAVGGEYITSSENLKVYFVVLNGPFLMENISLPQGVNEMPTTNHVFEVFDAQTGNLIVWGIYG
jgi:hypothetical protein